MWRPNDMLDAAPAGGRNSCHQPASGLPIETSVDINQCMLMIQAAENSHHQSILCLSNTLSIETSVVHDIAHRYLVNVGVGHWTQIEGRLQQWFRYKSQRW